MKPGAMKPQVVMLMMTQHWKLGRQMLLQKRERMMLQRAAQQMAGLSPQKQILKLLELLPKTRQRTVLQWMKQQGAERPMKRLPKTVKLTLMVLQRVWHRMVPHSLIPILKLPVLLRKM
jgi:hypothetical protein